MKMSTFHENVCKYQALFFFEEKKNRMLFVAVMTSALRGIWTAN